MFKQRPDEEAVVDQGGTSTILNIHYEKEELEGKNSVCVCLCVCASVRAIEEVARMQPSMRRLDLALLAGHLGLDPNSFLLDVRL